MELEGVRADLAAAHRLAVLDDLHEGTWNHFSVRVPGDPERILLTPPYTHWSQVTARDLIEVGPEERESVERAGGMLWTAYRIHAPIYAARPDVGCVLHTHPPHAVALSMLEHGQLEFAEQNALYFYGQVSYSTTYDGVAGFGIAEGEEMARALAPPMRVLLLKSHGVIVVGASVAAAYTDLYRFERACRAQVVAMSTGQPRQPVPAEAAKKLASFNDDDDFKRAHFEAMKRVLEAQGP
jgi:ribulose-5-phosphate 4-epimerase/fuculose-1-phosphate aldolase